MEINNSSEVNRKTYDEIAADYHNDHAKDIWDNDFLEDFCKRVPRDSLILDLGCGPGIETAKMTDRGLKVVGFDLSQGLLSIAKNKAPQATFIQGDMTKPLPFKDGEFDGLFAKASLLHVPKNNVDEVLSEMNRVTKKGGLMHIAVKKGDEEKLVTENDYGYEYSRFFSYWQPENLKGKFSKHDLKILEEEQWQNPGKKTVWLKYILVKE